MAKKPATKKKSKDEDGPFIVQCPPKKRGGCGAFQPLNNMFGACLKCGRKPTAGEQ